MIARLHSLLTCNYESDQSFAKKGIYALSELFSLGCEIDLPLELDLELATGDPKKAAMSSDRDTLD